MGRLGDKIWIRIAGRPVLFYSVAAFLKAGISRIVVVVRREEVERARRRIRATFAKQSEGIDVVAGGRERQDSVWNGISSVDVDFVLVHDAARPAVCPDLIHEIDRQAHVHCACVPGVPLNDTLKKIEGRFVRKTESRAGLYRIQTPQGFRRDLLRRAILSARRKGLILTDCSALVESLGGKVAVAAGDPANLKLTRPEDLKILEAILKI